MAVVEFNNNNKDKIISSIDTTISEIKELYKHCLFNWYDKNKYVDQYFIGLLNKYENQMKENVKTLESLRRSLDRANVVYTNEMDNIEDDINWLRVTNITPRDSKIY